MLELKRYTKCELANVLGGSDSRQALKNKLARYKVDYDIEGRGNHVTFTIKKINDPFKLYCALDLGLNGQCNFSVLKYFYYYYLCDDSFVRLTAEQKEEYMKERDRNVSRQTLRKWERWLERKGWMLLQSDECVYYFSKAGKHREATKEEYSEAWQYYWQRRNQGEVSWVIMLEITEKYGGVPRKHYLPIQNAFYAEEINKFVEIIVNSIESEKEPNN